MEPSAVHRRSAVGGSGGSSLYFCPVGLLVSGKKALYSCTEILLEICHTFSFVVVDAPVALEETSLSEVPC